MRLPVIPTVFLVILVHAALVMIPNFVVPMPERSALTLLLSDKFNMRVELRGDIRLRFLPRPQIILQDVEMVGDTANRDAISVQVPYLLIDLDILALSRQAFEASLVTLLYPQIDAQLRTPPQYLVERLNTLPNPGLHIEKARLNVTGFNPLAPQNRISLPAISIDVPARNIGAPLNVDLHHDMPRGTDARARFNLTMLGAHRYEIRSEFQIGGGEKLRFDGLLSGRSDWQFDGEMSVASNNMLAGALSHHLPMRIRPGAGFVAFEGLLRADANGLQSGSLDVNALGTVFQSRFWLDWPQQIGEVPHLIARLSTGTMDLNNFEATGPMDAQSDLLTQAWNNLASGLSASFNLEANQFDLAGETGRDLSLSVDWRDQILNIDRLTIDLPFRSYLIATGEVDLSGAQPVFDGSFSARSLDTLAAMIWLGDQTGRDLAAMAELVKNAGLQRASLVGDVKWSANALALNALSGRVGDDRFAGHMRVQDWVGPQADIKLAFDRFDLTDWGIAEAGNARNIDVNSVWQPVNRLLEAQLADAEMRRRIAIDFAAEQFYFGTTALGPASLQADIIDRRLDLARLQLSDIGAARITAKGRLNYDVSPAYGELGLTVDSAALSEFADPLLERLAPLRFDSADALSLQADLLLTGRDAPDWPKAKLVGGGRLGDMRLDFDLVTPSRTLDYSVAGSELNVSLTGAANRLAKSLVLPDTYAPKARGRLQLSVAAQSNVVSAVRGNLQLAEDMLDLNASSRPSGEGRRLEGSLSLDFADGLPILGLTQEADRVALSARMQLNATAAKIGFQNMTGKLGRGTMSGTGVISLDGPRPQLNANMALDNVDLSWALPRFGKNGWSNGAMRWPLFERGNADMDVKLSNTQIGHVVVQSANSRLKLVDGVLEAPQVELALLGGKAEARVLAEGGQLRPRFSIDASFSDISPAGPLERLYNNPLVTAALGGTVSLNGRGNSAADMMASLNGDIQFEFGPGALTFFDMKGASAALADAERVGEAAPLVSKFVGTGIVPFTRGLGVAQWREGRAENATGEFISPIPYGDTRLSFVVDALTREIAAGVQLFPEANKALSWQLRGDVIAPKISLDASAYDRVANKSAVTRSTSTATAAAAAQ